MNIAKLHIKWDEISEHPNGVYRQQLNAFTKEFGGMVELHPRDWTEFRNLIMTNSNVIICDPHETYSYSMIASSIPALNHFREKFEKILWEMGVTFSTKECTFARDVVD